MADAQHSDYDLFLSHSSLDKPIVRQIAERLRDAGVRVWFDEWQIEPGDSIPAAVDDGLNRSRILLLCLSRAGLASDWARLESFTFRFRDPLNKKRSLIPLKLDDVTLSASLSQFLYIDWASDPEAAIAKLVAICRSGDAAPVFDQSNRSPASPEPREPSRPASVLILPNRNEAPERLDGVAYSGDGRIAVSAGQYIVNVWDTETGMRTAVLEGHKYAVHAVDITLDARRVASGAGDNTIRIWDIFGRRTRSIHKLEGRMGCVWKLKFNASGRLLLSADNKTTRLWDVRDGKLLRKYQAADKVYAVQHAGNGTHVIAGAGEVIYIWDAISGRLVRNIGGLGGTITSIAGSPDGRRAVVAGLYPSPRVLDLDTGTWVIVLVGHSGDTSKVTISPDGRFAVTGSRDRRIKIWSMADGRCLKTLEGHNAPISSLHITDDGQFLHSSGLSEGFMRWNFAELVADL